MAKPRFLTKSRFKTGHECATKLHYLDDETYADGKKENAFLKALADGGYQTGELAKIYHPTGIEVTERDHHKAAERTRELLKKESVTIFEGALMHENLFVRSDIIIKKGNAVRILEVKASTWKPTDSLLTKKGFVSSEWEEYVADIAFQRYVAMKAFPEFKYACSLYLIDKDQPASVDGIYQHFKIVHSEQRTSVIVSPGTTEAKLGTRLLKEVPADLAVESFISQDFDGRNFDEYVEYLSKLAKDGSMAPPNLTRACGKCQFRVAKDDLHGRSSGFLKCWTSATDLKADAFKQTMIFDVWKIHHLKKDSLIREQRYFVSDLTIEDIDPEEDSSDGLTAKQRRWMQVEYQQKVNSAPFFDKELFAYAKEKWKAPYHFIDFETLTPAIPMHKGMRPYETIAFQFSHHVVDEKGVSSHKSEYINVEPGFFPNFEFVRALKSSLDRDEGTIFMYSRHENTVLNHIREQLLASNEKDKDTLIQFIDSITYRKKDNKFIHQGKRQMVDMLELVLKYYYSPMMGGSNSIKVVLPAVMKESNFLKEKYSKPTYNSANFKLKAWIAKERGKILDPYKSLPPLFNDVDPDLLEAIERLYDDDEIREGGSASVAYARMQFSEMSDEERVAIKNALLRYCELDTLAMVMIWEYWAEELMKNAEKTA